MEFKGTYTALVTPFKHDEVDYEGLKQNILFQIQEGVEGIVPLGTTGETPTLSEEEQEKIIKLAVETAKGKVKIMVGTGSNSTKHTIEKTQRAKDLGADAVLIVTPYYNKPTQEGIFQHF
ncbi:MAG: dihydrodipicolinate synthase family protein, partial [Nanoarchaeota archaeon]